MPINNNQYITCFDNNISSQFTTVYNQAGTSLITTSNFQTFCDIRMQNNCNNMLIHLMIPFYCSSFTDLQSNDSATILLYSDNSEIKSITYMLQPYPVNVFEYIDIIPFYRNISYLRVYIKSNKELSYIYSKNFFGSLENSPNNNNIFAYI